MAQVIRVTFISGVIIMFRLCSLLILFFFFFNDTATTEIYTLSLHDALPICGDAPGSSASPEFPARWARRRSRTSARRSEEHTSELQSQSNLVCRLLLEKKKKLTTPLYPMLLSLMTI